MRRQAGPLTAGLACQRKRLMSKSGFDEIANRERFCRSCFDRSREFDQLRADFRTHSEGGREPNRRGSNRCHASCAASGVGQKDRRTKCEDRHAFATNSQAPATASQSTSRRHDWRRRTLNLDIGNLDNYSRAGRTIRESRRWQQPHRCARRNAHVNRANAQHQRKRAAKIQSHRQSFEVAGRADTLNSPIGNSIAVFLRRITDGGSLQPAVVFA